MQETKSTLNWPQPAEPWLRVWLCHQREKYYIISGKTHKISSFLFCLRFLLSPLQEVSSLPAENPDTFQGISAGWEQPWISMNPSCSLLLNPESLPFFHKVHSQLIFSAVSQETIQMENRK